MQLKITTFNCENLFGRYRFLDKFPVTAVKDFETMLQIPDVVALEGRSGGIKPAPVAKSQRITTGKAILGAKPDILAVEEVENLATLRIFNDKYMGNYFDRIVLIDGNDARGIDVGLLIRKGLKADVMAIRTHVDDALAGGFLPKSTRLDTKNVAKAVFSRDCLEVDVKIAGKMLTFLVNHFKAQDGKATSTTRRINQAKRVAEIVEDVRNAGKLPIVMGDLNMDTGQSDYDNSLQALATSQSLVDPFQNVPNHWTHFYASKKTVSRLDYILLDKSLAGAVTGTDIFRNGLSPKCKQFTGPRLPSMSGNDLEASDHCPTSVILQL
jgi:endonuclease/exonuclease/phosphatase family metal-dependent hydrolase